ncbi:hypothetical protein BT96DRAFT_1001163 [Gymnopus androsaceus JB14]|uniref:SPX domain-containing protein n=1 Tax=Gymnopus androsaceus JB14 TaxID=1447944 RepID=A0A6A4H1S7_9AGAR|nr:hypothetical protein BT96DRAFT_1001163 [Gymnopus androsaceus JB14]
MLAVPKPHFENNQRVNIESLEVSSSELYTKLRSEYVPNVFESNPSDIQDSLLLFDRELDDYEQEIVCLEIQLSYIRKQQKRLMDQRMTLSSLSSLHSSSRKLPKPGA